MDGQPKHDHLITMYPQHAAEPFFACLRAGLEHWIDFGELFAGALLGGVILRHVDEPSSAAPGSLPVLFGARDMRVSRGRLLAH